MLIFHLDFNFVSLRIEFVKELLAKVAMLGYDAILWELENQVKWDSCPECVTPDSWSKEQFRELLAYSRKLKLEPIPLLQTIGHGEYVMMHEKYHPFREHPDFSDCYCTSNPDVRKFLKNWISEYCDLFGELKYFHLGGDEAYRFGSCSKCSPRDRIELYGEHINSLASSLQERNIRPGIWGDMILAEPENIDAISRDFIIWDWNYSTGVGTPEKVRIWSGGDVSKETLTPELMSQFPEILAPSGELNPFYTSDFLKNRGYDVVLCSAARSSSDGPFCPNVTVHAPNIAGASVKCRNSGLFGHCVTSWALRLNPIAAGLPLMALPDLANTFPEAKLDDLQKKTAKDFFGFPDGFEAASQLCSCDNRLRILSAVQWSGLKDSRPAPQGHLKTWIKRWLTENEPYWLNRNEMFASMESATQKGLAVMAPYAEKNPTAKIWVQAGNLQLKYVRLLKDILSSEPESPVLTKQISELKIDITEYFACEQTLNSAMKNAALITDPLIDYLEQHD